MAKDNNPLGLDPKKLTVKSVDHKFTTLQHKDGHEIKIAHNILSPKARESLKMFKSVEQTMTPVQAQEAQDQQVGKPMAEGGGVYGNTAPNVYGSGMSEVAQDFRGNAQPQQRPANHSPRPSNESGEWPSPSETSVGKAAAAFSDKLNAEEDAKIDAREAAQNQGYTNYASGGNVKEQKKAVFGSQSSPAKPEMREKHIEHIRNFAKRLLGVDVQPSGGKINPKTGNRRDENPEVGVDKPDWRSGKLESQWNPDAIVHELSHLILAPKGVGLKKVQEHMDKQYGDVQKQYGYMKQKRSQGEIQPMAVENMLRRMMGLPAATQSVPVKPGEGPRTAVDTGGPAAVRAPKGDKEVDLIRQARLLTPENKQRVHDVVNGKIKFHPEYGWQENPDALGAKSKMYRDEQAGAPIAAAEGGMISHQRKDVYDRGVQQFKDKMPSPEHQARINERSKLANDIIKSPGPGMRAELPPIRKYAEGSLDVGGVGDIVNQNIHYQPTDQQQQQPINFPTNISPDTSFSELPGSQFLEGAWENRPGNGTLFNRPQDQAPQGPSKEAVVAAQAQADSAAADKTAEQADATKQIADQQAANQSQNQGQDQAPQPQGTSTGVGSFGLGREQQAEGLRREVAPAGRIGAANVQSLTDTVTAQQKAMDAYNDSFKNLTEERQNIMEDLKNQHISPDAFWSGTTDSKGNTVGGHSKMMSALGMIIGGAGTADFLNHQMDMDLRAQMADLGRKQTMLNANVAQYGNIHQGLMATKIMQQDILANKMQEAINKEADPMARSRLYQALGQMNQTTAMQAWKFSLMDSMKNMNGLSPDAQAQMVNHAKIVDPEGLGKTLEESYVPGVGISYSFSKIPQETKAQLAEYKNVFRMLDEAINFKQEHPGAAFSIQDRARAQTLMSNISNDTRTAEKMGVIKSSELAMMTKMLGKNPAGFLSAWHTDPQLMEFRKLKQQEYDNLKSSFNLPVESRPNLPQNVQQQSFEGARMKGHDGSQWIIRNGAWVPQK